MLKKYYYCEFNEQLFNETLRNEYQFLAFCYGVYISFKSKNTDCDFSEYLEKKLKKYPSNWHFVNITHRLLKTKLKDQEVSRREIRKLGYSGSQSLPRCSKNALIIQNHLTRMVLSDSEFVKVFVSAINDKWKNIDDLSIITNDVLFGMIIGFQSYVLLRTKDSGKLYNDMQKSFDFDIVVKK